MIEVEHLTKYYGPSPAVLDVSFTVQQGEILGFLGPNGAGKSTTMRIITGYLPATSGTVRVAGFDVSEIRWRCAGTSAICPKRCPSIPTSPRMTISILWASSKA